MSCWAVRPPLCSYFSPDKPGLIKEIAAAYRACESSGSQHQQHQQQQSKKLLALVVPHGAACDGFFVAASAYRRLNAYLHARRCTHLTAVLLGTEHAGTAPVAVSRKDWATPLGTAAVDTAAVDTLTQQFSLPVNDTPHAREHSIENQLPFLLHGAAAGWDLAAAGCDSSSAGSAQQPAAAAAAGAAAAAAEGALGATDSQAAATLSVVPVSIGWLDSQPQQKIQEVGAAVRGLLMQQQQQQQQGQLQPGADSSSSSRRSGSSRSSAERREVVLIVTTDFTHAGPWYKELPPAGVSLEAYMRAQDTPVLQAIQQGSVERLLAAAAATRNSMCGLYPLAVALEALYGGSSAVAGGGCVGSTGRDAAALPAVALEALYGGSSAVAGGGCVGSTGSDAVAAALPAVALEALYGSSSAAAGGGCAGSSGSGAVAAAMPELLDYRAAHTIFERPDSTGFAAFAVYAR